MRTRPGVVSRPPGGGMTRGPASLGLDLVRANLTNPVAPGYRKRRGPLARRRLAGRAVRVAAFCKDLHQRLLVHLKTAPRNSTSPGLRPPTHAKVWVGKGRRYHGCRSPVVPRPSPAASSPGVSPGLKVHALRFAAGGNATMDVILRGRPVPGSCGDIPSVAEWRRGRRQNPQARTPALRRAGIEASRPRQIQPLPACGHPLLHFAMEERAGERRC